MSQDLDRCDPNNPILIPEIVYNDDWPEYHAKNAPGWSRVYSLDANGVKTPLKPHIRCKCGHWTGIGLHHVHADGRVTASFFDATDAQLDAMGEAGKRFPRSGGCGWHVFLKLQGWDGGDFPPTP